MTTVIQQEFIEIEFYPRALWREEVSTAYINTQYIISLEGERLFTANGVEYLLTEKSQKRVEGLLNKFHNVYKINPPV